MINSIIENVKEPIIIPEELMESKILIKTKEGNIPLKLYIESSMVGVMYTLLQSMANSSKK